MRTKEEGENEFSTDNRTTACGATRGTASSDPLGSFRVPQHENAAAWSCYCFPGLNCWIVDKPSLEMQEMIEKDR